MKKIVSLVVCAAIVISSCVFAFADIAFSDLPSNHWAYSYVNNLVSDGTINGFEDGSFRPGNTVSRAEFVKMIGKGPVISPVVFNDIAGHWAYDYIMYSGLAGASNNNFNPDTPITRGDVVNLIWARNGSVKGVVIPEMITNQGSNSDAVAWMYAYGVMTGDDGINLRLNDTLTRAEAAALIVRARTVQNQNDFINAIDENVYKTIFEKSKLFDKAYLSNAKITNDELALAMVRLGSEEMNLTYRVYPKTKAYEGENAFNVNALATVIGEENNNAAFGAKNATVQDALSALTSATLRQAKKGQAYGAKEPLYSGVSSDLTDREKVALAYAYKKGVTLYAGGQINPANDITMKELACLLLQLDGSIAGFESIDVINAKTMGADLSMNTALGSYPANAAAYKIIGKGIPNEVYTTAFSNAKGNPVDCYNFVREYKVA
ncbi:MAG: S-layer homology domain-containing protein, partial [Eubacteriales bacterium]|nr:S-layer homology domain-containing protein [Eubacteriales bacterium]